MKKTRVKMMKTLYLGMSVLDMETVQNFVTRILIALLFILKPKIFLNIFPMMLIDGLIHLTMIKIMKDRFQ